MQKVSGVLAHLARALRWQRRGDRFKSGTLHHEVINSPLLPGCFLCRLHTIAYTMSMLKQLIQWRLEQLTKRYLETHKPKLIVVTGSVGKTSTKLAIATVLAERYKIRVHEGNHNTHLSVPLAIMGIEYPENIRSIAAWRLVFQAIRLRIEGPSEAEVIVQELGTDTPGDIRRFGRYLRPDVAVVTAVSPEHMEFFDDLDAVAREELAVAKYSALTIVNREDINGQFAKYAETQNITTYGLAEPAEYRIELDAASPLDGKMGQFVAPDSEPLPVILQLIGTHNAKAAAAAGAVASRLGLTSQQIAVGIAKIAPVAGRMQLLRGVNESTVIDDTYNASPLAVKAAMDTLYAVEAPQRIALLGSMNELGKYSQQSHAEIGGYCDPQKLDWVVTIGRDAREYLAPAAREQGCQVMSFESPYQAGGFVHGVIKPGAVVLVKGSQNRVFAEEAVKVLLHSAEDENKLVRQSDAWMKRKSAQFDRTISPVE